MHLKISILVYPDPIGSFTGHTIETGNERNIFGACLLCDYIDIFGYRNLHIFRGYA